MKKQPLPPISELMQYYGFELVEGDKIRLSSGQKATFTSFTNSFGLGIGYLRKTAVGGILPKDVTVRGKHLKCHARKVLEAGLKLGTYAEITGPDGTTGMHLTGELTKDGVKTRSGHYNTPLEHLQPVSKEEHELRSIPVVHNEPALVIKDLPELDLKAGQRVHALDLNWSLYHIRAVIRNSPVKIRMIPRGLLRGLSRRETMTSVWDLQDGDECWDLHVDNRATRVLKFKECRDGKTRFKGNLFLTKEAAEEEGRRRRERDPKPC